MLIFKAKVFLYSELVKANSLISGVRCSLIIEGNAHICQIESFDGRDIPLETEVYVKITTISGEISLLALKKDVVFTLYRSKEVGKGVVKEIEEVYLEKKYLEVVEDKMLLRNIISYAEQLSCALIYEDVYDLIQ